MTTERKTLAEWRATRRLSMAALAREARVTPATIESIEKHRHPPSLKTMRAIIAVFGIGLDAVDWGDEWQSKTLAPVA